MSRSCRIFAIVLTSTQSEEFIAEETIGKSSEGVRKSYRDRDGRMEERSGPNDSDADDAGADVEDVEDVDALPLLPLAPRLPAVLPLTLRASICAFNSS